MPTATWPSAKPQAIHERYRQGYAVAVDARVKIPVWVQYVLTEEELMGPGRRRDNFQPDRSIPKIARAELADYRSSGYARGHMTPAGDMRRSRQVMDESLLLSNANAEAVLASERRVLTPFTVYSIDGRRSREPQSDRRGGLGRDSSS